MSQHVLELKGDLDGCLTEANRLLGLDAEVLAFGDLNMTGAAECVVVKRIPKPMSAVMESYVSDFAILQHLGGRWVTVFAMGEAIGVPPRITDPVFGFKLSIRSNSRGSPAPPMVLYVTYLDSYLGWEGAPGGIAWNAEAGRYQDWDWSFARFYSPH